METAMHNAFRIGRFALRNGGNATSKRMIRKRSSIMVTTATRRPQIDRQLSHLTATNKLMKGKGTRAMRWTQQQYQKKSRRRLQPQQQIQRQLVSRRYLSIGDKSKQGIEDVTAAVPQKTIHDLAKLVETPGGLEKLARILSPQAVAAVLPSPSTTVVAPSQSTTVAATIAEPSKHDLRIIAFKQSIPFVGFGIMDNAILIIAGDAIDTSLGVMLGISTMCAAAIGNIVSDVAGIMCGTAIEDFAAKYMPWPKAPDLTTAQRSLRSVRFANQFGNAVGIVIGCIIGMFPLAFIDSNKVQTRKQQARLDTIFQDVVQEAGELVKAKHIFLYLLVDRPGEANKDVKNNNDNIPSADGKFLYAKYDDGAGNVIPFKKSVSNAAKITSLPLLDRQDTKREMDGLIPLGKGIVSRAALTGEALNIYDVHSEPDFSPEYLPQVEQRDALRSMLCVPVLDAERRTIAVIQAFNKRDPDRESIKNKRTNMWALFPEADDNSKTDDTINGEEGATTEGDVGHSFTSSDVQMLKALASHISVALQQNYNQTEEEGTRLKDTIALLKDYGLDALKDDGQLAFNGNKRKPLFPEKE